MNNTKKRIHPPYLCVDMQIMKFLNIISISKK